MHDGVCNMCFDIAGAVEHEMYERYAECMTGAVTCVPTLQERLNMKFMKDMQNA